MQNELWTAVTMRLVAVGHSLAQARRLAALILVQILMLCVLSACCTEQPGRSRPVYRAVAERAHDRPFIRAGGISPAGTGAAARRSRAFMKYW